MSTAAPIDAKSRKALVVANLAMILTITIHDLDHLRQAAGWCYTITATLWLVNASVYVPSAIALALGLRGRRGAATATSASALLIAILFAKVHLWKPMFPVWGIWNRTFFELRADALSWSILAFTVLMGVAVAMTGAWAAGRIGREAPTRA